MSKLLLTPDARQRSASGRDPASIHVGMVLQFDNFDEVEAFATLIRDFKPVFLLGETERQLRTRAWSRWKRQDRMVERMEYGKQYTTGQLLRESGGSRRNLHRDIAECAISGQLVLTKKVGGRGGTTTLIERRLSPDTQQTQDEQLPVGDTRWQQPKN